MEFKAEVTSMEMKTPAAMEMETGGEVLPVGPRPGKAICSFWQGRVEIALRVMAVMVGSLPALITAAVGLGRLLGREIPGVDIAGAIFILVSTIGIIIMTGLAILKELVMIVLRLCNCGCVNLGINIILIIAIIFSFIFSLLHLLGAVGAMLTAVVLGPINPQNYLLEGTRASLSLCSIPIIKAMGTILLEIVTIFCFVAAILNAIQASWSIAFLAKKWNKNVEKYTLEHLAPNNLYKLSD